MTESPLQKNEAHFSEAAYFDELADEGEVAAPRPRGVQPLMWEDLEGQERRFHNSAHTSMGRPGPSKQNKNSNKRARCGDDLCGKVRVADGRTAYLL